MTLLCAIEGPTHDENICASRAGRRQTLARARPITWGGCCVPENENTMILWSVYLRRETCCVTGETSCNVAAAIDLDKSHSTWLKRPSGKKTKGFASRRVGGMLSDEKLPRRREVHFHGGCWPGHRRQNKTPGALARGRCATDTICPWSRIKIDQRNEHRAPS
ncbi:uncharacterized protein LY79DRAFT_199183 [Colletotrichum navitas]|uniref:Uncharacterized protein n=1 Tax=Colletotrichum navitas TaxID=681940 RepID=A0AAD8Q015_9PEZI|nr:uncharacterized protein LY79DRAFT_199183 [Colletotrichum navitas]KAK1590753.1 hypothetical protein LY79DRAFT_199183 [Colletotrichum navitas]